jgi:hypothetical protein
MVETADARQPDDLGAARSTRFGFAACGCVADRSVDSIGVVAVDVLAKQPSQMARTQNDDMVEKLPANAAHETLGRPILPRAPKRRPLGSQAEAMPTSEPPSHVGEQRCTSVDVEPWASIQRWWQLELGGPER